MKEIMVWIGSTNPVKIEATRIAFSRHFQKVCVKGYKVASGVPG